MNARSGPNALAPTAKVPIGYAWIIEKHELAVFPPQQISFISKKPRIQQSTTREGLSQTIYPPSYDPGPTLINHLEFAFKQEGLNLEVLSALFFGSRAAASKPSSPTTCAPVPLERMLGGSGSSTSC